MDLLFLPPSPEPTNSNKQSSSTQPTLIDPHGIDFNASISAASSSFWGFVSSATDTIKQTTASVVSEVKKDLSEFSQSLSEEFNEPTNQGSKLHHPNQPTPASISVVSPSPAISPPLTNSSIGSPSSSTFGTDSVSSLPGSTSSSVSDLNQTGGNVSVDGRPADWSSKVIDNVERLGDNMLEKAIHLLPSSIWSFGGEESSSQTLEAAPVAAPNPTTSSSTFSPTSVKSAKLLQLESSRASYLTDPTDASGKPSSEYRAFFQHFHLDYDTMWKDELDTKIIPNLSPQVKDMYATLVNDSPDVTPNSHGIPSKLFWCRYLFRLRSIEAEESRRSALLEKIQQKTDIKKSTTNDDSWGDEEEEATTTTSKPNESASPIIPTPVAESKSAVVVESTHPTSPTSSSPVPINVSSSPDLLPSPRETVVPTPSPPISTVPPTTTTVIPSSEPFDSTETTTPVAATQPPIKKVTETKEAMRARIEAEARERVQKKLAEKKAAKEKEKESFAAIPPPHPTTIPQSQSADPTFVKALSRGVESADQVTTVLSPTFSEIINSSVPTNTTPEPLKRRLAAQTAQAAAVAANPHVTNSSSSTTLSDLISPSPPLTASSRSSSQTSSQGGWENIDDLPIPSSSTASSTNTMATATAALNQATTSTTTAKSATPIVTATQTTATEPTTKEDDWDSWE